MKIGIVGLGHAFYKQINALRKFEQLNLVAVCDNDETRLNEFNFDGIKTRDYKQLADVCDYVLIASPPKTHLEIVEYFVSRQVGVLLEKPVVVNKQELEKMEKILAEYDKFYSLLHFSFGEEILWYQKHGNNNLPNQIKAYISDKYVEKQSIKNSALSLEGAYLDETINPLSAIAKIFDITPKLKKINQKTFKNDVYDYYSLSCFCINDCEITVEDIILHNPTSSIQFLGWYTDINYTQEITKIETGSHGDLDLYAKWESQTSYIRYHLFAGVNNPNNPTVYDKNGNGVTLLDATKTGYEFLGWYTEEDYINKVTTINPNDGDVDLYAKWELVEYRINYYLNGGENNPLNPSCYTIDDEFDLQVPTRYGYEFVGWSKTPLKYVPMKEAMIVKDYIENELQYNPTLKQWEIHRAIDYVSEFLSVYAVADGVVSSVGTNYFEGNIVEITHADGYVSRYASLSNINVRVGLY